MSKELIQSLREAPGVCIPATFTALPEYTNWREEQVASKETVCIGCWTFTVKSTFKGSETINLLKDFSINSFGKFDIGTGKHICNCNEAGKVISQGVCLRLGEDEFYINGLPVFWLGCQVALGKYKGIAVAHETNRETFSYQVAGPNSLYLLEEVANERLRDIKFMHFRNVKIGGRDVRIIGGLTMAGEVGFELQLAAAYYHDVYDTLIKVGKKYGIRELGNRSCHINHIEACFPTTSIHYLPAVFEDNMADFRSYMMKFSHAENWVKQWQIRGSFEGNDVRDYYRSPVEMGWAKNVKFDHDFLGRKALEEEVANPKRNVVTLEYNDDDVIDIFASYFREEPYEVMDIPLQYKQTTWVDSVSKGGNTIGVSTGPGYSYYFRKMLALAYLEINHIKPGTAVEVLWGNPGTRQKIIRATVAPAPYKTDKRRTDLTTLPKKP